MQTFRTSNLLFVSKYTSQIKNNLKTKFDGQIAAFARLGFHVNYLEWEGKYIVLREYGSSAYKKLIKSCRTGLSDNQYFHSLIFVDIYRAALRAVQEHQYSIVYMRNMPYFPPAEKMAKEISEDSKLIVEIPTYPIEIEDKYHDNFYRSIGYSISRFIRKRIYQYVDLIAAIGEETHGEAYGRPAINISNGIEIESVPIRTPDISKDSIDLLLLGSMCGWHGFDRVIEGLKQYSGHRNVKLHFVGNDGDGSLEKWKEMASSISNNVIFHGAFYGEKLDEMVNRCDIAIGSLGLYRSGIQQAAPLKTREYMSRGIPFVYAADDFDVEENFPYVLKVKNDESPINIEDIISFAETMKMDDSIPQKMRQYATEKMTWDVQFTKVLNNIGK